MIINNVKINGLSSPMGYTFPHVTISWQVGEYTSRRQSRSRVVLAEDITMEQIVAEKSGVLPCSGVTFEVSLKPRTTYYALVQVTGEDGEAGESVPVSFETGKMEEPWLASWIGMQEGDDYHPIFEKSFSLKRPPVRARLYITGVGLYEASLNGVKIGDDVLAPFFNDYHCAIQCQTYDLTDQLSQDNTLSVMLGNGWYKGRLGYEGGSAVYGSKFACISGTGMNSLNHYAYGSVVNYAVRYLAGFQPLEPGCRKICIAPQFDGRLGYMYCSYCSASGKYR